MKCNVGDTDRGIRIAVGAGALTLAFSGRLGWFGSAIAFALATSEFVTATTRYCPLNEKLGINTCQGDQAAQKQEAKSEAQTPAAVI